MSKKTLSFILLLSFGLITNIKANNKNVIEAQKESVSKLALEEKLVMQLNSIDIFLEKLAQAVTSGSIKVKDKNSAREYIVHTRTFISKIKSEEYFDLKQQLSALCIVNKILLEHITLSVDLGLNDLSHFDEKDFIAQAISRSLNLREAIKIYNFNELTLARHEKNLSKIGLTATNTVAQSVDKFTKDWHIQTFVKRSLPYAGFILFINYKDQILAKVHNMLPQLRQNPNPQTDNSDLPADSILKKIFKIDEGALFTLGAGVIFKEKIAKDYEDLYDWTSKQFSKGVSLIKGENYESDSPIKKVKITFDNIFGYDYVKAEFTKVIDYIKSKKTYDLIGAHANRGFFLIGATDIAKNLAHSIAGEITKNIEKEKPGKYCGVYDIHSLDLIPKKDPADDKIKRETLKEIIDKAGKHDGPCVLVIREIDALAKQEKNAEIWSDIINNVNSILKNPKKQIIIVTTTQQPELVKSAISDVKVFGKALYFEKPEIQDRKSFFEKELKDRSANVNTFDIDMISKLTQNCTYEQLNAIIARAFTLAQISKGQITQTHIEKAIDEIALNISYDHKSLTADEINFISLGLAGKIFATKTLAPEVDITRATILPVSGINGLVNGSIFLYSPETIETNADLSIESIIELAKAQTQKLLNNGKYLQKSANVAKAFAFANAKSLVFDGLAESAFSKEEKELKLKEVSKLINSWELQVSEIIKNNKNKIINLAQKLRENKTLTAQDIKEIV